MDAFEQGYEAWNRADTLRLRGPGEDSLCPYERATFNADQWWSGWQQADRDNSQFGMGA